MLLRLQGRGEDRLTETQFEQVIASCTKLRIAGKTIDSIENSRRH